MLSAGETTGIGGADLALLEGLVAGAAAARHCGTAPALGAPEVARLQRRITRLRRFADALHRAFRVEDGWQAGLDDDTVVLPGHGEATTIGAERRTNPFLQGLT